MSKFEKQVFMDKVEKKILLMLSKDCLLLLVHEHLLESELKGNS